ncbi:POT peptide transporter [Xylariaceae sp. FL0594]|nr:POT peptide transporter [Xylariaceae sp. FL0594]
MGASDSDRTSIEREKCHPHTSSPNIQLRDKDASEPTEEDLRSLRRVGDAIPYTIFFVVVAEVAERFTYRSLTGPIQNYIQHPLHNPFPPGALGRGQAVATAIGYFFQLWCYLTPLLGAFIADTWLGRFKTICLGTVTAFLGVAILFITSIPAFLERGTGFPGLLVGLVVIGLGAGGIKSNVGPLVAEQYAGRKAFVRETKDGERVIVDPDITVQTIFNRYYWVMNIGSASGLIAVWVELKVGFWAVFLIALSVYAFAAVVLVLGRNKYVTHRPQGSTVARAAHALWIGLRNGRNMDKAKPSYQAQQQSGVSDLPWDDSFIDELKVALTACRVLSLFPFFWLCYGNTVGNVISLAGNMNTLGLPNDFLAGSVNPVSILVLLPLLDRVLYPALRRMGFAFLPVTRIACGFFVMSSAIALAAGLQSLVYKSPPRSVNFFTILPIYVLTALAEILAFLSSMEYAYTKAPKSMKSLIASINLLLCAVGSALGLAISPTSNYGQVLYQFISLSAIMFLLAILFYVLFKKYNKEESRMNQVGKGVEDERRDKV